MGVHGFDEARLRLRGTRLRGTRLRGTRLRGTRLRGTGLRGGTAVRLRGGTAVRRGLGPLVRHGGLDGFVGLGRFGGPGCGGGGRGDGGGGLRGERLLEPFQHHPVLPYRAQLFFQGGDLGGEAVLFLRVEFEVLRDPRAVLGRQLGPG
ncbi:pentapeptide repeat-containing protein [Streptomyces sp. NBC_00631]|uniref:pentapeptide repeat-containing protein n=1 Tax=Streptomyces sp. NBC_00631 TaxID=2975793 RepID=UPI003863488B